MYRAIPMPKKGLVAAEARKEYAFLELEDGTRLYLEAYGVEQALRPVDELRRFDGQRAMIVGIVHRIMPSPGAGLVAPCLSQVESVVAAD